MGRTRPSGVWGGLARGGGREPGGSSWACALVCSTSLRGVDVSGRPCVQGVRPGALAPRTGHCPRGSVCKGRARLAPPQCHPDPEAGVLTLRRGSQRLRDLQEPKPAGGSAWVRGGGPGGPAGRGMVLYPSIRGAQPTADSSGGSSTNALSASFGRTVLCCQP